MYVNEMHEFSQVLFILWKILNEGTYRSSVTGLLNKMFSSINIVCSTVVLKMTSIKTS